jgi:hypothetical protein
MELTNNLKARLDNNKAITQWAQDSMELPTADASRFALYLQSEDEATRTVMRGIINMAREGQQEQAKEAFMALQEKYALRFNRGPDGAASYGFDLKPPSDDFTK